MMNYKIEVVTSEADARQLAEIEQECFVHPLEETQIRSLLTGGSTLFLAAREGEILTGSVWVQTVLDEGGPHIAAAGSPMRCCMRWNGLAGKRNSRFLPWR